MTKPPNARDVAHAARGPGRRLHHRSGRCANIGPFIEGTRQYVRDRVKQMEGGA